MALRSVEFLACWFSRENGQPGTQRAEQATAILEHDAAKRDLASNLTPLAGLIEQGTAMAPCGPDDLAERTGTQGFILPVVALAKRDSKAMPGV